MIALFFQTKEEWIALAGVVGTASIMVMLWWLYLRFGSSE